jgi:hypothetical protein
MIPLAFGRKTPHLYLGLLFRMAADDPGKYPMIWSSVMYLSPDPDGARTLLHYDYERDKADNYPEAHLQVCASSEEWEEAMSRYGPRGRPLKKLHLPVGGRRFRPTVEDLIEFLIIERLATGRRGWEKHVEEGRRRFEERQLRAAVTPTPGHRARHPPRGRSSLNPVTPLSSCPVALGLVRAWRDLPAFRGESWGSRESEQQAPHADTAVREVTRPSRLRRKLAAPSTYPVAPASTDRMERCGLPGSATYAGDTEARRTRPAAESRGKLRVGHRHGAWIAAVTLMALAGCASTHAAAARTAAAASRAPAAPVRGIVSVRASVPVDRLVFRCRVH